MTKPLNPKTIEVLGMQKDYESLLRELTKLGEIPPISKEEIDPSISQDIALKDLESGRVLFEKIQSGRDYPDLTDLLRYASHLSFPLLSKEKSVRVYAKILGLDPENLPALRDIGIELGNAELYEQALMLFDKGLKINGNKFSFLHRHLHRDISDLVLSANDSKKPAANRLPNNEITVYFVYDLDGKKILFSDGKKMQSADLHQYLGKLEKIEGAFHRASNCPYNHV